MRSFLGVPVIARGRVFSNLYLTDKRGAEEFDADDEHALVVEVDDGRGFDPDHPGHVGQGWGTCVRGRRRWSRQGRRSRWMLGLRCCRWPVPRCSGWVELGCSSRTIHRVTLSDRLARFNRRLFNPGIRTFAGRRGSPVAVVEHRGRRSGRRYRTPVLAFRVDDGYVVALFYGADSEWARNVLAAGSCTLQRGGLRIQLTDPRMLDIGEGLALMPALMRPALRLLRVSRVLRLSAT